MKKDSRSIIKSVQLTEKGTRLMETSNKYLFGVDRAATKLDVARAVADIYKVTVTKVNTMNYSGKKKRERSQQYGRRAAWKRAVVTLQDGDHIDFV